MCTKQQYQVLSAECREGSLQYLSPITPHSSLSTPQRGISLIELIMFIVILGIALTGIMLVINQVTGHSADTLLRKQALAIAESKMEEIELQSFANIASAVSNVTPVSGLTGYAVSAVMDTSAWGNIPATSAAQITVTVTDPAGQAVKLTGYRTNY